MSFQGDVQKHKEMILKYGDFDPLEDGVLWVKGEDVYGDDRKPHVEGLSDSEVFDMLHFTEYDILGYMTTVMGKLENMSI